MHCSRMRHFSGAISDCEAGTPGRAVTGRDHAIGSFQNGSFSSANLRFQLGNVEKRFEPGWKHGCLTAFLTSFLRSFLTSSLPCLTAFLTSSLTTFPDVFPEVFPFLTLGWLTVEAHGFSRVNRNRGKQSYLPRRLYFFKISRRRSCGIAVALWLSAPTMVSAATRAFTSASSTA